MKSRIISISVLMLLMLSLAGCDFLRTVAGRPTSRDIAERKDRIALHEENVRREQARKDSVEALEQAQAARKAAAEAVDGLGFVVRTPDQVKSLNGIKIEHAYSLMIGTYHNAANAEKLAVSIREQGFPTDVIKYFSGAVGIGVCATDDPIEFLQLMEKVKGQSFCRPDAWILKNVAE